MLSYSAYRLIHFVGVALLVLGIGGLVGRAARTRINPMASASRWGNLDLEPSRALRAGHLVATVALSLLAIPFSGFGMLATLGLANGLPGWILAKLGIWVVGGALAVAVFRWPGIGIAAWILTPLLVLAGAYLAIYRPF